MEEVQAAPGPPNASSRSFLTRFAPILAFAVYLITTLGIQLAAGSYSSELAHYSDEPAHVITSLMIRDYLVDGLFQNPITYAENYYIHYPKVAIGFWPPFFHATTALWTLVFGSTKAAILLWMAVQTALLALTIFLLARRVVPAWLAFVAGAALLMDRLTRELTTTVMVDILIALLCMWATWNLVLFFREGETKFAVRYGILTGFAMMTKGNADSLVLVPLFLLAITRRWEFLRKPGLYYAAAIVVILGLPWQILSLRLFHNTIPISGFDPARIGAMASGYLYLAWITTGFGLLAPALVGAAFGIRAAAKQPRDPNALLLAGMASLAASVLVFHILAPLPGPEGRYMSPVVASVLVLAAAGIDRFGSAVGSSLRLSRPLATAVGALACLTVLSIQTPALPSRAPMGLERIRQALDTSAHPGDVILISSDAEGEGAFITEVAFHDHRPDRFVLRASKVISESTWFRGNFKMLMNSPQEVQDFLDSVPVDILVLDQSSNAFREEQQLLSLTCARFPERWTKVAVPPETDGERKIEIYRRLPKPGESVSSNKKNIQLHMRFTLGRDLVLN